MRPSAPTALPSTWALAGLLSLALVGAAGAQDGEGAPKLTKLTKPPKLEVYVEPAYPESARSTGQSATVTLSLDLSADGTVLAATPTSEPNPAFDAAAVQAAMGLRFEPAEVDGVPAPVRIGFRYRFALRVEEVAPARFELRGRVVEAEGGRPLPGVEVALRPTEATALTGEDGSFAFEGLLAGVYAVQLSSPEHVSTSVEQPVPPGASVVYRLSVRRKNKGVDEELVIRIPRQRRGGGSSAVAAAEARNVPGVMGDALAVVQNLPGVARASAGSGEVVVWGSAPAETRIYVDDVPIPYLYHRGGLRSVVNDSRVASVELVPGGFGVSHGRATGGLVQVTTGAVGQEGVGGYLGADLIDSSAALTYRQAGDDGQSVALAGRYGYLDRLLPALVSGIERAVPLPAYWDGVAKWQRRQAGAVTEVLALAAFDEVDRQVPQAHSDASRGERSQTWFSRLAVKHEGPTEGGGSAKAVLYAGVDRSSLIATFGAASATSQEGTTLRGGLLASRRKPLGAGLSVVGGLDVEASQARLTRAGTLSLPAREGDQVLFGQPPGDQVNYDRWTTHLFGAAPFVELEAQLFDRLTLTPGVRLEALAVEGERLLPPAPGGVDVGYSRFELFLDPRLRAAVQLSPEVSVNAALGLYHQPPEAADLSAVFGSTSLTSSFGVHAVLGASARLLGAVTVEGALFAKQAGSLAARSSSPSPQLARALTSTGESRSHGAQLVVRPRAFHGLSGWLSYAYSHSERRDGPNGPFRLFDFDQPHVLTAVASYELPWQLEVGARYRASTGYPRTAVTGAYFDARANTFQPQRGPQNGDRLPPFSQLDLHLEKSGRLAPLSFSVYLDLVNVLQQANAEEAVYGYDWSERRYLTGLPFLAVLGFRVEG